MAARGSSILILILLGLLSATASQPQAARIYKVPLIRNTIEKAGQLGQPVTSYYAPVDIGTPPKRFNIQFDVGLNELFVPHYNWNPFKSYLHYGSGFQCKLSSSCRKTDQSMSIEYQHCKLTGKPYDDVMSFSSAYYLNSSAAVRQPAVPISLRQNFLAISDASDARFKDLVVDGFFGLSASTHPSGSSRNLLVSLHQANLIDNLQFSLWFNPVLDSPQGGELVVGGVDESRYRDRIYWHSVQLASSQWTIGLQHISLGHQVISCYGQNCQLELSSSLNEVYGPRAEVQKVYSLLSTTRQPASELEYVDCRRISSLPILTFTIDGIPYALLPSNYVRKITTGTVFKSETCYVAILASDQLAPNRWILGTNFLGAYYSIFDITYRQVGFASLR